jgi:hypothetical protein
VLRDDVLERVAELLHQHAGEAVIIQVIHQPELCACGGSRLQPISCTCEPTLLVLEIPDHVATYIEPVFLRRLLKGRGRENR